MSKTIVNTNIKLKEGGGMINTPDGLGVDVLVSFPVYEELSKGDLLKTINDNGTYKVGKIVGINEAITSSVTKSGNIIKAKEMSPEKIAILTDTGNLYVVDYDGETISNRVQVNASSGVIKDFDVLSDHQLVFVSHETYGSGGKTHGQVADLSGRFIVYGGLVQIIDVIQNSMKTGAVVALNPSSVVFLYGAGGKSYNCDVYSSIHAIAGVVSNNSITLGSGIKISEGSGPFYTWSIGGIIKMTETTCQAFYEDYDSENGALGGGEKIRQLSVDGLNITAGQIKKIPSTGDQANYANNLDMVRINNNTSLFLRRDFSNKLQYSVIKSVNNNLTLALKDTGVQTENNHFYMSIGSNGVYLLKLRESHLDNLGLHKIIVNENDNFIQISNEYSVPWIYRPVDNFSGNDVLFLTNNDTIKTQKLLLDYFDFIGIADKNYQPSDDFLYKNVFTGLSDLTLGGDYYVGKDGQSLTLEPTYNKKIGRAISDTTIIKE